MRVCVLQDTQEETPVINQYIVEKIMGSREGTRELEPDETEGAEAISEESPKESGEIEGDTPSNKPKEKAKEDRPVQTVKVTEYYVKYKNL